MENRKDIAILAIETSCDETAAAVVGLIDGKIVVRSSIVRTQIGLHAKYGGVVPNLAAREHVENIIPVVEAALAESGVGHEDLSAVAVTSGPGLMPALLVGVSAGKTLALVWRKPLLGINHLEGHIYANFIGKNCRMQDAGYRMESEKESADLQSEISNHQFFPLLALIVSGGHTELVLMRDHFEYEILGETRDDAAGEAFDKAARILGLPYPGGPAIALRADNFRLQIEDFRLKKKTKISNSEKSAIENLQSAITLPRPMIDSPDLDFSFSGLKTAVLYLVKEHGSRRTDETFIDEVAHEFQEAVVDVLVAKTRKAIERYSPKTVIIAGGVSANERLRTRLRNEIGEDFPGAIFSMPEFRYSLDNAAMIGAAAVVRFARLPDSERDRLRQDALALDADANLAL